MVGIGRSAHYVAQQHISIAIASGDMPQTPKSAPDFSEIRQGPLLQSGNLNLLHKSYNVFYPGDRNDQRRWSFCRGLIFFHTFPELNRDNNSPI